MSERFVFIAMLLLMGVVFYGGAYKGYRYYKKNFGEWKAETAKLRRTSWPELIAGGGILLLAARLVMYMLRGGGDLFLVMVSLVLAILVMAVYIVGRRGGSVAVLMFAMISVLYTFLIVMFIGLPQKAPELVIDHTEITQAHTTTEELLADGFDIYVKQQNALTPNYEELLSSGSFKKYPADRSFYVQKGFQMNYAPYLLVKDGVVIGRIGLYGEENKEVVLEDCKVVRVELSEDSVKALKANSIRCKLNGLDLLAPLAREELKKTFGRKLRDPGDPSDLTEMHYGITWPVPGHAVDDLFWNRYYSVIYFDEGNAMIRFELSTKVAVDRKWAS